MTDPTLGDRVAAIERITALFKWERQVYLVLTTTSALIIISSGVYGLFKNGLDVTVATLMFGSTGLVTLSVARLLTMWNRAIEMVAGVLKAGDSP
jgi:hypothetical protein